DAIAGFDNNDVIIRNCRLNTACMPLRFGGNNVLVENCISDERRFGSRLRLTDEDKILGRLTNDTVRHESWAPFSYYCDRRADPRKPTEIVIRNCNFAQARELIRIEFDGLHRWCCNMPMRYIRFENCRIEDLQTAGMIWSTEDEKITVEYVGCKIAGRAGMKEPICVAGNFKKILFEDCTFEGFEDPTILIGTDDPVEFVRTEPITVRRTTQEECIAAHPTGLASQDLGKNLRFK
ncbi:MAG: hypothetical protein IJ980_01510, partial [Oscillospiraceae bacterium]|nr:hypothetical protein [Oscillospiraceae bacterium]